ncbi:hypothetical protein J3Q64DRAFT_1701343 [Phycomyces blakesleeanus]|uniref:Fungal-type protein kinase domain-containing protein n=2 Tax=Phycomyces blakesleeanus TaxID=4837 RepID=A0A163D7S0_PHYB8|nr:hypothetical protein PHYBLDRAFT_172628 [Phycomyces blakesleeanus NRRL 1555(-)]OAD69380.1 hypothetical protein PHYBLDRAFT_172628 [Phycomyces blakesleeanus NRRL 1555(-)]|eukprot:XP_018287420.1 hypothetical protein PHYBLDRAFT_172628 [Phycomyces blakesleeanus NRRL 1555(-)]
MTHFGADYERTFWTIYDSVKQDHSMIDILKGIANTHTKSSFNTFLQTKVFGVHTIKTTIILSELQMDDEGKFIQGQFRVIDIPTRYKGRNKWFRIFDMLT